MPRATHCPCGMRLVHVNNDHAKLFCSASCRDKAKALRHDHRQMGIKERFHWEERDGVRMFMVTIPGIGEGFFKPWRRNNKRKGPRAPAVYRDFGGVGLKRQKLKRRLNKNGY